MEQFQFACETAGMREVKIDLSSQLDCYLIAKSIERAIHASGLKITLSASLKKFPGCIHWHLKHGRESGTLEITFWPQERRGWFTIQGGRQAVWIDEQIKLLDQAIQQQIGAK